MLDAKTACRSAQVFGHGHRGGAPLLTGTAQIITGVAAGFGIGVVTSIMGVAGGELLIPTLVLLFGADIKLAESLSVAISLPTMIVGFAGYSRVQAFVVLQQHLPFVLTMAAGSLIGVAIGGRLLGFVSDAVLLPMLTAILLISSVKVWQHQ